MPARLLAPLLLVAATLGVYWPALHNGFVNLDDNLYVTANPEVLAGLTTNGLGWAFTNVHTALWCPLTWLSHMLDCQLFGLNPAGHHATSLVLHAANSVLVFLVLKRMTGAFWRSALVGGLFAVHPLRVESVAWVAERKDVLSALFGLLALSAYARYAERRSAGRFAVVVLWFALGLMAKPMLVTLPLVFLLLDYWPLGRLAGTRPGRRAVLGLVAEKLPLLLLAAGTSVVTLAGAERAGATAGLELLPLPARIANALVAYARYLGKTIWPSHLAVFYPMPAAWPAWQVAGAACLLTGSTAAALLVARRHPYVAVGWLWFVVMLLPVIGLVQAGGQAMADRFTYLPLVGIFLALAWLVPAGRVPRLVPAAAVVLLGALAVGARAQVGYWRDSVTLFTHALAVDEADPLAHASLGFALLERGENEQARAHLERAVALRPAFLTARIQLGNTLVRLGRFDEAIAQYRAALETDPRSARALNNLGYALLRQGRVDDAIPYLEQALRVDPSFATAHNDLGLALAHKGRRDEARAQFEAAARADPSYADPLNNLGRLLMSEGRVEEGLTYIGQAIRLQPGFREAHAGRVAGLVSLGRYAEAWAAVHFARAQGSEPPEQLVRALAEKMPEPAR